LEKITEASGLAISGHAEVKNMNGLVVIKQTKKVRDSD
jgi:hypothetical protein